ASAAAAAALGAAAAASSIGRPAAPCRGPAVGSVASCEEGSRFEMISKDKYLTAKKAASTVYFEGAGGMRCCDRKVGSGKVAERGLLVGIHFEGFRLNGRPVESSWNSGPSPLIIQVGSSPDFPALGEGVIGMKEGGRRELVVPPRMNRPGVGEVTTYTVDLYSVSDQVGTGPVKGQEASSPVLPSANEAASTDPVAGGEQFSLTRAWRRMTGAS
ncbi:unnamed protein product, partial [Polarella glacialis]